MFLEYSSRDFNPFLTRYLSCASLNYEVDFNSCVHFKIYYVTHGAFGFEIVWCGYLQKTVLASIKWFRP